MSEAVKKSRDVKVDLYSLPEYVAAVSLRDLYMAENLETQLKMLGPKARMVVGGHNTHLQVGHWGTGLGMKGNVLPAMGGYLRKRFGDAYYVFGFDFDRRFLPSLWSP